MVDVIYKRYGLKINAIWFYKDIELEKDMNNVDIVFFHGIKNIENVKSKVVKIQYSLTTNLLLTAEELFKRIGKNFRYQINRSEKENVKCTIYSSSNLQEKLEILDKFEEEYDEFTKLKGIANTYNENAMKKYIESNSIVLSKAYKDEEVYAQHIYICDGKSSRLLYSVSNFRTEGMNRNLIGRANKYLHWQDILYLKNSGFEVLDWGGISSITEPNGIDKFKKEFGGKEEKYFNVIIGKSFIGKLVVLMRRMKRG